jgi:hypothetical protein
MRHHQPHTNDMHVVASDASVFARRPVDWSLLLGLLQQECRSFLQHKLSIPGGLRLDPTKQLLPAHSLEMLQDQSDQYVSACQAG